jgi:hypothetical protein
MSLKLKSKDGVEFTLKDPPLLTTEIIDKLSQTAYHLHEISKLWSIPDLGHVGYDALLDTNMFEGGIDGHEKSRRAFIYDWYQNAPFVPLFFNRSYYQYLTGKMLELGVKQDKLEGGIAND